MIGQRELPERERQDLGFYDVFRARFHSPAKRKMIVKSFKEDQTIKSRFALMPKLCMVGETLVLAGTISLK